LSSCTFIATNYEMPEVDNTKVKYITVKEDIHLGLKPHELVPWANMDPSTQILFVEKEDDLYELVVKKDTYYDVSGYSSYPFV
jgi:hypothetical protein